MAEPKWELMDFPITRFSNNHLETFSQFGDDSVRVYNTTSYQYRNIWADFSTQSGYEYRYTCDVSVTSGNGMIVCRQGSTNKSATSSGQLSGTVHVDKTFQHDATINRLTLFCTYTTNAKGDVTYSKFRLYRRRVS